MHHCVGVLLDINLYAHAILTQNATHVQRLDERSARIWLENKPINESLVCPRQR